MIDLEDAGERLMKLFEDLGDGELDDTDVEQIVSELYESVVGNCRPILLAAPSVVQRVGDDLALLVIAFLQTRNRFRSDERLQKLWSEGDRLLAEQRKNKFQSYLDAGFARPEAMALLLQDIANAKATISRLTDNMSAGSRSARRSS